MLFRLVLLMYLFGSIRNLTTKGFSYQYDGETGIYLLSNKNTENIFKKNDESPLKWHDIVFITVLISLFIIFFICLYFQQSIFNCFFRVYSKIKNNNDQADEQTIILHQSLPLKRETSMYLTVPQPSYMHH